MIVLMYAIKTLFDQRFRFFMTASGVALCVILIHFLLGIYKGVADGSVEYVRSSKADLWIMQKHATNILRSTSMIRTSRRGDVEELAEVESAAPLLFIIGSVLVPDGPKTAYIIGYDPEKGVGGPPSIYQGRNIHADDEIVLDRSFAAKYHIKVGDTVKVKRDKLRVVGLSSGTNMFVLQYVFVTLNEAFRIINFGGMVSCFQVKLVPGSNRSQVAHLIEQKVPDVVVYGRETFLENNIDEMESGVLPMLFVIALIGSVVLTAILSLILSINVLERRKDYAVMKALGAPRGFVSRLVLVQSLVLSISGLILGLLLFFPLMKIVEKIAPEVSVSTSAYHILVISLGVVLIGLISSLYPISKLKQIYPMEVFNEK